MRALPPTLPPFWQTLAHRGDSGGIAFDINTSFAHSGPCRSRAPHPLNGRNLRNPSPVWRSGPLMAGPRLFGRQSVAHHAGVRKFRFSAAMDKLFSQDIKTLTRGSQTWSRNTSCLQQFLQQPLPGAWPPRRNAVWLAPLLARQSPTPPMKTLLQVPRLVRLPGQRPAAFRACHAATDLTACASARRCDIHQGPSGAHPRVALSYFPPPDWPRIGRSKGREPCSRKS